MDVAPLGVIEGYYGPPWSFEERAECIDVLARHGANAYVWAPKSEPRHRDAWREPFTRDELDGFAMLASRVPAFLVSVGLTPGRDATVEEVAAKLGPAVDAGCGGVTLCVDDLPELSAAAHHRAIANGISGRLGVEVWLVPTHYAGLSGSTYLDELLDGLDERILVMWTGEHVVTDAITVEHARARTRAAHGRRPLVWDNTPVNDAMMTSLLHLGTYAGREPGLRGEIAGLLLNPMQSMRASLPTTVSACAWWRGDDPVAAWAREIDALGVRTLAEATSFPGDLHWPGHEPTREWLDSVAALPDPDEEHLRPWAGTAREGARIALAALDVLDAIAAGVEPSRLVRHFATMAALGNWLRSPVRTLGAGPRTRPVWTQDAGGRFAPTDGSIELTTSIPEHLVSLANQGLRSAVRG